MTPTQQTQHQQQQQQQQQTMPIHTPQSPVHVYRLPHERGITSTSTDRQPARLSPLCHLGPQANTQTNKKKKKKSVRFKSTVTVVTVQPLFYGMDKHEKSRNLYYTRRDMKRFSQQVLTVRREVQDVMPHITAEQCLTVVELRGLERKVCPEIAQNRTVATRAVLSYQHRLRLRVSRQSDSDADSTSSISSEDEKVKNTAEASSEDTAVRLGVMCVKMSRWSRDVALERARADFWGAYSHLVPGGLGGFRPKVIEPFPSLSCKKRTQAQLDDPPWTVVSDGFGGQSSWYLE